MNSGLKFERPFLLVIALHVFEGVMSHKTAKFTKSERPQDGRIPEQHEPLDEREGIKLQGDTSLLLKPPVDIDLKVEV